MENKNNIILLESVRLSFPHLFEKQPIDNVYIKAEDKRKYSATFILSKDNEKHVEIVRSIENKLARITKEIKIKQNPHILVKDGDEELELIDTSTEEGREKKLKAGYKKGSYIITATNSFQPKLSKIQKVLLNTNSDENPFYPGCYVHALIELSPYKFNGSWKGISNRLHHVLFHKDGEIFGGTCMDGSFMFETIKEEYLQEELF